MAWTDTQKAGLMLGGAGIGAGLGGLFGGGSNPADAAMPYLGQIPGQVSKYGQPWWQSGQQANSALTGQYGDLLNNPGGKLNSIGAGYQQSPGFKFALDQALQGAGHAAAAGGMAGSPQHEQQNMGIATGMANQDYYNWLQQATGLYGQGLQGSQLQSGQGLQAGQNISDQIAQALAAQAQLKYAGQANQNQSQGSGWGNLLGGAASIAGAFL